MKRVDRFEVAPDLRPSRHLRADLPNRGVRAMKVSIIGAAAGRLLRRVRLAVRRGREPA